MYLASLKGPEYFHLKRASSEIGNCSVDQHNMSGEMVFIEHLIHTRQLIEDLISISQQLYK